MSGLKGTVSQAEQPVRGKVIVGTVIEGISPSATVEETEEGAVLTIVDKYGTSSATLKHGYTPQKGIDYFDGKDGYTPVKGVDYKDGKDGKDGVNGKDGVDGKDGVNGRNGVDGVNGTDGKDGVSPTARVTESTDGIEIVITDVNGTTIARVHHGKDGVDGKDGVNGIDGTNGKDGADGTNGKDGTNGTNGKDGVDGKSAYEYAKESGFTGTEEEFAEQLLRAGSWNDLTDKPFYENCYVGFTWDGDTTGLPSVNLGNGYIMYKVCEDVLTYDELIGATATTVVLGTGATNVLTLTESDVNGQGTIINVGGFVMVALEDASASGVTFTKGIWHLTPDVAGVYASKLVVNDIKTLDIKYIPDELYTAIDTRIDAYIEEALGGEY